MPCYVLAKAGFQFGQRPKIAGVVLFVVVKIEGAAAKNPALDLIGMDLAGLLDGKPALAYGATTFGLVGLALLGGGALEQAVYIGLGLAVGFGRDAGSGKYGKADIGQSRAQLGGEGSFALGPPWKKASMSQVWMR